MNQRSKTSTDSSFKMDFSKIPLVVFTEFLLPNLHWNDLLRLRRVSKMTKGTVDDIINQKKNEDMAPEIEINEEEKSLRAFMDMGIWTTKIFVNNSSGYEFYQKAGDDVDKLVEALGPRIKHLRVRQVSQFIHGKEREFLEGFPNLETFESGFIGGWDERKESQKEVAKFLEKNKRLAIKDHCVSKDSLFPDVFKQLKKLRIGNHAVISVDSLNRISQKLMNWCISAEDLALPFNGNILRSRVFKFWGLDVTPLEVRNPLAFVFDSVKSFLDNEVGPEGQSVRSARNLKFIDFDSFFIQTEHYLSQYEQERRVCTSLLRLCDASVRWTVKLRRVDAAWFKFLPFRIQRLVNRNLGTTIVSLINMHPSLLSYDMPYLEQIEIRKASVSNPGIDWRVHRRDWPSLRSIDIKVDDDDTYLIICLYEVLFRDVLRPSMVELCVNDHHREGKGILRIHTIEDIVSSCPNIKKLKFIKWSSSSVDINYALKILWRGLTGLEEVSLEYCKGLSDDGFVGEDEEHPVFCKLRGLRKLNLSGLDQMPGVTDITFDRVIRRVGLTHLTLTSNDPIKSVTAAGIRALLEGTFVKSIQKFPFQGWSLLDVADEEFTSIEKMFRSSDML